MTGGPLLLPMVCKRGTEQGDHHKPPLHWALLPWTSMQKVPTIFYYHIRQDVVPCSRVSTHAFPQRQWGWRSRKVYLNPPDQHISGCTPCYGQDALPHHATLLATPPLGVSPAFDYKTSKNNKNNTAKDVLLT